jgi:hypothetical protein
VLYDPGGSFAPSLEDDFGLGSRGLPARPVPQSIPSSLFRHLAARRCCPPSCDERGTHDRYFEAQSHGPCPRCLRFAAPVTRLHARLASGWRPAFPGRGLSPLGSIARFHLYIDSSLPRLCLAQRTFPCGPQDQGAPSARGHFPGELRRAAPCGAVSGAFRALEG